MLGITSTHLLLLFTLFTLIIPSLANGGESPTPSTPQEFVETLNGRFPVTGSFRGGSIHKRGHASLERRLTNAQRLARGLPIAAPPLRRMKDRAARRTLPSNTAQVTVKGLLWCDLANGTALGWLLPDYGDGNTYGRFTTYKQSWGTALEFLELEFSYDPTAGPNVVREEIEITTPTGPAPAHGYFGAVKGLISDTPDLGNDPYAYMAVTSTVSYGPGAVPTIGQNAWSDKMNTAAEVEAAIWTYLPSTKEIGVKWVNTDHSKVPAQIWIGPFDDLFLGTNATAFNLRPYFPTHVDILKCRIDDAFVPYNGNPYIP